MTNPWIVFFEALFSSRRLDRILALIIVVVILNFFAFFVISLSIGGDALNGKVVDGHYYFYGKKGRLIEVSSALFAYSRWHGSSISVTMPPALLLERVSKIGSASH